MTAGTTNFPGSLDSHTSASPLGFGEVNNQAYTLSTAAHTNSVTTITVASTSKFPSKGYLVIKREIVSYTGTTATTFTGVTRGVGGTTAAAFGSGTLVEQVPIAANHNDLAAALVAVETVLGAGITSSYGVMRKIAEVSGTGASGVLEFTSIPATYRELQLSVIGRSDGAGTAGARVRMTFETSPTAGTYNLVAVQVASAAVSATENIGVNDWLTIADVPTAGNPSNLAGAGKAFFFEYANTNFFKSVHVLGNQMFDVASGSMTLRNSHACWESTAAIDRIRLTLSAGNWTTQSRATLWGVPA